MGFHSILSGEMGFLPLDPLQEMKTEEKTNPNPTVGHCLLFAPHSWVPAVLQLSRKCPLSRGQPPLSHSSRGSQGAPISPRHDLVPHHGLMLELSAEQTAAEGSEFCALPR